MKAAQTFLSVFVSAAALAQSWIPQQSGTTVPLRGVSAVSGSVAWASGAKGTFLRTTDGGATWMAGVVTGAANLDFRSVRALDERTAFLVSSGPGELSRIYKTTDGGAGWRLLHINPDPKGFWDGIAMWDATHGIMLGDPVNGRFVIYTTSDGVSWQAQKGPQALTEEGAFAASNTSLFTRGAREAWFGTGGPGAARVFHTDDGGKTWTAAKTPMRNDSANAGIFSLAFSDPRRGIAVGGDYSKPSENRGNIALTEDGGRIWTAAAATAPPGFRSAVAFLDDRKMWIATGTSGSDVSLDGGKTWKQFDTASYNAMSFAGGAGWAVGPGGVIARWRPD